MSKPIVLNVNEWSPCMAKFMPPKTNASGGKSITLISTQTNRSLHVSTPLLMTWGISDFVDEKTNESDGKFTMTLNFPNADYSNPQTELFLKKLKEFENFIIDEAVKNSDSWWGEELSREIVKHNLFPLLKYSKDKITKKFDYSKPPSIRAKVPNYENKWAIEIYDTSSNLIFPNPARPELSPAELVPKLSNVACVVQCGGIWIGGKGWGLTWKLIQCIVKPREVVSVFGKCHIMLSSEEKRSIESQQIQDHDDVIIDEYNNIVISPVTESLQSVSINENNAGGAGGGKSSTMVDDSDDEPVKPSSAPVANATPVVVKKEVVKKEAAEESVSNNAPAQAPANAEPVVKKTVKKVVAKKPSA
jgi:hypothetical protein